MEKLAKKNRIRIPYTAFSFAGTFLHIRYSSTNISTATPQYTLGQWSSPISVSTLPMCRAIMSKMEKYWVKVLGKLKSPDAVIRRA